MSALLLSARRKTTVADFPGLPSSHGRRNACLSQEDVAALVGVTPTWYGGLERGNLSRVYTDTVLDRVSTVLRLSDNERMTLFLLVKHRATSSRLRPGVLAGDLERAYVGSDVLVATLAAFPWAAVITDPYWQVVASNPAFQRWFASAARFDNLMLLMLTDPKTREQLVEWEDVHAPALVAQLRAALIERPADRVLQQLVEQVVESSSFLHELWDAATRCEFVEDGDRRQIWIPGAPAATTVQVVVMRSAGAPALVVREYVPVAGFIPDSVAYDV